MAKKPCLQCGKLHDRRKFCCNKCKDRFHNINNPRGYYAHNHPSNEENRYEDGSHPFSEEGVQGLG